MVPKIADNFQQIRKIDRFDDKIISAKLRDIIHDFLVGKSGNNDDVFRNLVLLPFRLQFLEDFNTVAIRHKNVQNQYVDLHNP